MCEQSYPHTTDIRVRKALKEFDVRHSLDVNTYYVIRIANLIQIEIKSTKLHKIRNVFYFIC